jgi:hypothetical protein
MLAAGVRSRAFRDQIRHFFTLCSPRAEASVLKTEKCRCNSCHRERWGKSRLLIAVSSSNTSCGVIAARLAYNQLVLDEGAVQVQILAGGPVGEGEVTLSDSERAA